MSPLGRTPAAFSCCDSFEMGLLKARSVLLAGCSESNFKEQWGYVTTNSKPILIGRNHGLGNLFPFKSLLPSRAEKSRFGGVGF